MLIQFPVPLNSPETLSGVLSSLLVFHILYRRATLFNTDLWLSAQDKKRGRFLSQTSWGYREGDSQMRMKLLVTERERTTAESFLLCSNGKSSQEMEREMRQHNVRGEHFQSNESRPPAWVQHPSCNSNLLLRSFWNWHQQIIIFQVFYAAFQLSGIKTCTDFAVWQEVTKVNSNNYSLTSLLLRFLLHPKSLEQWHWLSTKRLNRGTDTAHTFLSFRRLHLGRTWFPAIQSVFEI